ncbi:MAG: Mur ligase family protein [Candidatus Shapirobacteria bacterium]
MKITKYQKALDYLHKSIPRGKLRYPGIKGLERQKLLLEILGKPQNKYKVIHIAGTSGKGSTASFLSHLLADQGFKVGLTVSPHILYVRERIQINNKNISEDKFTDLVNRVIPAIEELKNKGYGEATYFEIVVAMFYLAFADFGVDYAVIETGMGGLMDGTNVVESENKIALITRLGLDHTRILGNNLTKIATQKAGIIFPKNTVITLWQHRNVRKVLDKTAKKNSSVLWYLKNGSNYKNVHLYNEGLKYNFNFGNLKLKNVFIKSRAIYQVENSALAMGTLEIIGQRDDFKIDENILRKTLADFKFLGRMDIFKIKNSQDKEVTVIFDGAHNPQKMVAFTGSLKRAYPKNKFEFIVAFKQKKEAKKMLQKIVPLAQKIILTSFVVEDQDMAAISQATNYMVEILETLKYKKYQIIANPNVAIKTAINESPLVAVTGSLYLLGKIYEKITNNKLID